MSINTLRLSEKEATRYFQLIPSKFFLLWNFIVTAEVNGIFSLKTFVKPHGCVHLAGSLNPFRSSCQMLPYLQVEFFYEILLKEM